MDEWYENETLWDELEPVLFTPDRMKQAVTEVDQILALVSAAPNAILLDLGCGVGRHSLEFAKRGLRVTGVDRTASYLETASECAAARKLNVEWIAADMREFHRDTTFHLVVSLLTSFGYFTDLSDDRKVLDNIFRSLVPGGMFVLDIMSKEVLARVFRQRDWQEPSDGVILLEERAVTDDWSRLDIRWIILRGDQRREHRFRLRLYAAAELKDILADTGFIDIKAFGSMAGSPYDQDAERLVMTARKP